MKSIKKLKIKICGITNLEDIDLLNLLDVDYIGFVLHTASKRCCSLNILESLLLRSNIEPCFVFGYDEVSYIYSIYKKYKHYSPKIQLPFSLAEKFLCETSFPKEKLIVSYSMISSSSNKDFKRLEQFDTVLLDTPPSDGLIPGGTGIVFDWSLLNNINFFYWLAGGLNPINIEQAIRTTNAIGFDVASGVEASYGKKDPNKLKTFISLIRDNTLLK